MYLSICRVYGIFRYPCYPTVRQMTVRFGERFKIARAGSNSPTAHIPVRYEHFTEFWIVTKFRSHLRCRECHCVFGAFRSFDKLQNNVSDEYSLLEVETYH